MKLLILVPTAAHKVSAGSRIRYDRLAASGCDFKVTVQSLDSLTSDDLAACNVCILSKVYATSGVSVARELRRRGKVVGFDLFDDYFSSGSDARLTRFRIWLSLFADSFDFALGSTPTIRRVIENFAPKLPVLLFPDAFPEMNPSKLTTALNIKRQRALATKVIDAVWFGIGANPLFPAGLSDLASFGWSLHELAKSPFNLKLTIVTDNPAQTGRALSRLGRSLPDFRLETWSLDVEKRALDRALITFIPVNGQSFSRAKSLNRALTAIASGSQVLTPGFPLYEPLGTAIYREAGEVIPDLQSDCLRIRRQNITTVVDRVAALSSLPTLARELQTFLQTVIQARVEPKMIRRQALVFGQDNDRAMLAVAKSANVLTVRSPYTKTERAFDIRIDHRSGLELDIWLAFEHMSVLTKRLLGKCSLPQRVARRNMVKVNAGAEAMLDRVPRIDIGETRNFLFETLAYSATLADIEAVCRRIFPTVDFLMTDSRAYMWPPSKPTLKA